MRYDQTLPPATKGIIILDTGAILRMLQPIDTSFLEPEFAAKHKDFCLMKMLRHLAGHGYQILIPEMVAFECARVLRDGKPPLIDKFHVWNKHTRPFFQTIANDPYAIQIVAPSLKNDDKPARWMNRLWELNNGEDTPEQRTLIAEHIKTLPAHSQYGDMAAKQLVNYMKKTKVPLFYLSGDKGAMHEIIHVGKSQAQPVCCINPEAFYEAFKAAQLFPEGSIKSNIPYGTFFDKITEALDDSRTSFLPDTWHDEPIDCSHSIKREDGYIEFAATNEFLESMKQFAFLAKTRAQLALARKKSSALPQNVIVMDRTALPRLLQPLENTFLTPEARKEGKSVCLMDAVELLMRKGYTVLTVDPTPENLHTEKGSWAAIDLAEKSAKKGTKLFYLCDDPAAMGLAIGQAGKHADINAVSSMGLYNALRKTNLLESLGIAKCDPQELSASIEAALLQSKKISVKDKVPSEQCMVDSNDAGLKGAKQPFLETVRLVALRQLSNVRVNTCTTASALRH